MRAVPQIFPISPAHEELEAAAHALEARARVHLAPQFLTQRREGMRTLALWHLASLDAATVAAVWSVAFAWVAGMSLPLWVVGLQALAVWTVYVGDRLLDARAGLQEPGRGTLRARHIFHWRHRRLLLPLAALSGCAVAWMIFRLLPVRAREDNSVLALAALAYFTRVHSGGTQRFLARRLFSKELLVGVLFTGGCALPTVYARAHGPLWPLLPPALFFAALAWLNCYAIDRWESHAHPAQSPVARVAGVFGIAGLALAAVTALTEPRGAALVAAGSASALLLAWLDRRRVQLSAVTLRAAADLVLLTPALLLPLAWIPR